MDGCTAYEDLTALGVAMPDSAQQWAQRPPARPPCNRTGKCDTEHLDDPWWIMLGERFFFVAGYTSGGAPCGMFADDLEPYDDR